MTRGARCGEACGDVVGVRRALVIRFMTGVAIGGNRGVVVVHMATGAGHRDMRPGQGKCRVVVIERRRNPRRSVVAQIAGLREPGSDVVRARSIVEIGQVTGDASGAGQLIVSVDVALRALQRSMRPGKRKSGAGVIEDRAAPGCGRMTGIASGRESRLRVVGVGGAGVILHVASRACPALQAVVPIKVALRAWQRSMRSSQCEAGTGVIKGRAAPRHGAVALLAGLRERRLHMIGIGRALVILQVTGNAGGIGQLVVSVDMTLRALQRGVPAGQRESGAGVIKGRSAPGSRGMTGFAGGWETYLHMVGVGGAVVILHVTGGARSTRQAVIPANMAQRALQRGMRAGQREPGVGVIEGGAAPRGGVVTLLAGLRKSRLHVVGISGPLKVLQVAGYACGIRQVEVPIDVALRTWSIDVRSRQREPGLGVIEGGVSPRGCAVTGGAGGWYTSLFVIWIAGAVVVLHVAGRAIRAGKVELAIGVAL